MFLGFFNMKTMSELAVEKERIQKENDEWNKMQFGDGVYEEVIKPWYDELLSKDKDSLKILDRKTFIKKYQLE